MLLWDEEMASEREALGRLDPAARLALAVDAVEWTTGSLEPPIATERVRSWIGAVRRHAREAVRAGDASVHPPEELLDAYEEADEAADEPGASHLLSAALACCEPPGELDAERLYGILSFCYEGVLDREDVAEWSPEEERRNRRCRAVIDRQKELIARAVRNAADGPPR